MSPRVVVTGLGLLSPLGEGPEAHSEGFLAGRSAVGPLTLLDPGPFPFRAAGEVRDFVPRKHIDQRKSLKLMTRAVRLGMSAAHMAVEDSGLDPASVEPVRFGIFVGAPHAYGEPEDLLPALEVATKDGEFDLVAFGRAGLPIVNPLWLLKGLSNNVLGFTSLRYGAMGPNANLSGSGAGGAQAIGEGWRAIADGRADVALCGGYDSLVSVEGLTGYGRLGLLTTAERPPHTASRPFDAARDGFAPAEGGAFVMLETLDRAASRGARIYGEIVGAGDGADAFDPAAPDPRARGLVVAARSALRAAGASPADVAFVVAHAAGSPAFDPVEATAIRQILGTDADEVPVTAPKGCIGHTVAASGAFGAAAALLMLSAGAVAPTANLETPDPACDLRHVQGDALPLAPPSEGGRRLALVDAVGLGGQSTALLLAPLGGPPD